MSLSVQPRSSSSARIHSRDGIAVSMAIASRVRSSARTWTFVARTPTTLWSASNASPAPDQGSGGRGEPGANAVEGLVDDLRRGALDHARADPRQRAEDLHGRGVVHRRGAFGRAKQVHLPVR